MAEHHDCVTINGDGCVKLVLSGYKCTLSINSSDRRRPIDTLRALQRIADERVPKGETVGDTVMVLEDEDYDPDKETNCIRRTGDTIFVSVHHATMGVALKLEMTQAYFERVVHTVYITP